MASSSKVSLAQTRSLDKYTDESGFGRPQTEGRAVTRAEIELAKECFNCGKHIKKIKGSLVCICKKVIYCSFNCQQSSEHKTRCKGKETLADPSNCVVVGDFFEEAEMRAFRIRKDLLMQRISEHNKHSPGGIMAMAEAGDTMAAYVVGSAFANRKICNHKDCEDGKVCLTRGHMPKEYLKRSIAETDEIAIKWLKMAAEGGIPEAMFLLADKLQEDHGLLKDKRVAHFWLANAYSNGKMGSLLKFLESGGFGGTLVNEFHTLYDASVGIKEDNNTTIIISSPTLAHLLMATRWKELENWGGKTANGKPFFGRLYFSKMMKNYGKLVKPCEGKPAIAFDEKKKLTLIFKSARLGSFDTVTRSMLVKERIESNLKFMQGVKAEASPDFQIIIQTKTMIPGHPIPAATHMEGRTSYPVNCKHNEMKVCGERPMQGPPGSDFGKKGGAMGMSGEVNRDDMMNMKAAGKCGPCIIDAFQRLNSVARGLYSISLTKAIPDYGYAARYVTKEGVICQDIFKSYSKPDMTQVLQCLMSNPADLHPLSVAEDSNLFWPIIWYWGSVFYAIQDTCDERTLRAVYEGIGPKMDFVRGAPASALAAFPEKAAGEWRIACGSEQCPQLDHEIKFNLCKGCKVRRYCNEVCQRNDWSKHKKFCRAVSK